LAIHGIARRGTGSCIAYQPVAKDVTQEVFLRFQGLPRFSLRSKFTTWLFQVTKNRVLDELRAAERRPLAVVTLRRWMYSTRPSSGWKRSTSSGAPSRT